MSEAIELIIVKSNLLISSKTLQLLSEVEIAKMVQQLINPINNIEIETSQSKESNTISILLTTDNKDSEESYSLKIESENRIELKASSYSGLFYAYQSLRQLCGVEFENGKIKNCYQYGEFKKVQQKLLKSIEKK